MESFAEYLKKYLGEHAISFSQAAKMTGIERTILSRYANGNRRPNTMEVVVGLADGLHMSQEEKRIFCDAYKRMCISEEFGVKDTILAAIVNVAEDCIEKGEEIFVTDENWCTEETAVNITGEDSVIEAVSYLLQDAKYAKIHFTPKDFQTQSRFKQAFSKLEGIETWEQMMCFEHREWKYGEERMLNLLHYLPYLFACKRSYTYYHYRRGSIESDQNIMNQYVLTDKGIVFFDKELENGFYSNQKAPCAFYSATFDAEKKKCRVFAEGGEDCLLSRDLWIPDVTYYNLETGMEYFGHKEAGCMWIVNAKKQAVCIREAGTVHVMWKYVWNDGE